MRARPSRRALAASLAALAAAACAPAANPAKPPPGASAAPRAEKPASAAPAAQPSGAASAAPGPSFPPVPLNVLRGQVKLDAAYMVAAGAGNLTGGAITASTAGLMTGGNNGTLIGNDGSTLIGNDGSTLIGNDGSTLMTGGNNGTLIGNDGSTMVAAGSLNYRFGLLQASAAPALAFGAERPAARMRVRVYELATGRAVLAARDPAAQRGAFVFTDAEGRFEAPVRQDAAANLLVYADVGGVQDARLRYSDLLTAGAAGASGAIDEHRSLTSFYIRLATRERLRAYLATDPEVLGSGTVKGDGVLVANNQALLDTLVQKLYAIGKEVRLDQAPQADQDRTIQALQDLLLSNVDLTIPVHLGWKPETEPYPFDPAQRAFDAMDQAIVAIMAAAEKKMNGPDGRAYFTDAAADKRGFTPIYADVRKPADLGRVFIDRYVSPIGGDAFGKSLKFAEDLGMDPRETRRFRAGADAFVIAMLLPLALDQPPASDPEGPGMFARLETLLRAKGQGLADRAIPQP